jgi:predicted anti-sigma-YlaC factor YlaD
MPCDRASEMMSARLDDRVSPAESKKLDEHLASCAACRELWRRLRALDAVLAAASLASAPAALQVDVLERLNRRGRMRRGFVGAAGLALGSAAVAGAVVLPLGLRLLDLLGIAPALVAGLPETAAHLLPSIGSVGRAATLLAGEIVVPLALVALCGLATVLTANVVWLGTLRRFRARH